MAKAKAKAKPKDTGPQWKTRNRSTEKGQAIDVECHCDFGLRAFVPNGSGDHAAIQALLEREARLHHTTCPGKSKRWRRDETVVLLELGPLAPETPDTAEKAAAIAEQIRKMQVRFPEKK